MQVTDKFRKELCKFYMWATDDQHLVLKKKDSMDTIIKCDENCIVEFKEPGRNKMDTYIKALISNYSVFLNGKECEDYKVISNEFKENKPKRKRNVNVKKNEIKYIKEVVVAINVERHDEQQQKQQDNVQQSLYISSEPLLDENDLQQIERTGSRESDSVSDILKEIDEIVLTDVE